MNRTIAFVAFVIALSFQMAQAEEAKVGGARFELLCKTRAGGPGEIWERHQIIGEPTITVLSPTVIEIRAIASESGDSDSYIGSSVEVVPGSPLTVVAAPGICIIYGVAPKK